MSTQKSQQIVTADDDLLTQIAKELDVDVTVLEDRLEMVAVTPDTSCVFNGGCVQPK